MKTQKYTLYLILLLLITACQKETVDSPTDNNSDSGNTTDWLIPVTSIADGGPGKDGIPALTNPELVSISEISYLTDDDLVLGYVNGDIAVAYPHPILDWHEIINDNVGDHSISIIYCPLTGTGIGWDRILNGTETTFGVSGLLYNSNLIPYDRLTNSNWSQMLLKSVNGSLSGQNSQNYNLVETTWKTWKMMYPSSKVVSLNTGHNRNYGSYPYGGYRTDELILFQIDIQDNRLQIKNRVLGIIVNSVAKAYSIDLFGDNISSFNDDFQNTELVITGSKAQNFMVAFNRNLNGNLLTFTPLQNSFPAIMVDNEGTNWDAFGRGISGPRTGAQLESITQFIGYWFAWATFYPNIELHSN